MAILVCFLGNREGRIGELENLRRGDKEKRRKGELEKLREIERR